MNSMTVFRHAARYNVLTPVALLAALCMTAAAPADDRVVAAGTTDSDGVQLNAGDSLTNAGTINNTPGNAAVDLFPGPGNIIFILNEDGAVISSTSPWAIGINGTLGDISNHGTISAASGVGVGVNGDVGAFLNTGIIASDDDAFGNSGDVGSFVNEGEMTSINGHGFSTQGNVGSVLNSGTMTGGDHGIDIDGDLGTFANSGKIVGQSDSALRVGGNVTSFENTGTITGTNDRGVVINGDVGGFTNSGTIISAVDRGASFNGFVSSFVNSGTISGADNDALRFNGGAGTFVNEASGMIVNTDGMGGNGRGMAIDSSGTAILASFSNHGSILADLTGGTGEGVALWGPNAIGSFLNTGTIKGAGSGVDADASIMAFENSGTITGLAFAGIRLNGNTGSFLNTGMISSPNDNGVALIGDVGSFTNAAGGEIAGQFAAVRIDGSVGNFENAGSISSSAGRGIEFNGLVTGFNNSGSIVSFQNGVTFRDDFINAANSGTIISTAPGGEIGVRINEPGGTFTNSGTIEGSAGVAYILNSAGDNLFANSGTVRGAFTAIAFDDGADGGDDTLIIKTGSELFGEVRFGAGNDTFDFSDFQGSALLEVHGLAGETLVAGDNLYYFDQPNDIVGIVSSDGVTAAGQVVATDLAGQIANLVQSQLGGVNAPASGDLVLGYAPMPAESEAEQAMAVFDPVEPTSKVWGSVFGGASHDDAPDLGHVFGGLIAGGHMQPAAGTTLGLLGGYAASRLETGGNHTIDSGTGVFGVYGSQSVGVVEIDFSVLAGWSGHSSSRDFVALGVAETATADYSSWFIAPALGAAVPVLAMENGEMRIAARAGYIGGEVEGYSETGSSMNLTVGAQTISLLDGRIGLESEFAVGSIENPTRVLLEGGIFGQSNLGGNSVPISFLGQTQNVAAAGDSHFGIYGGVDVVTDIGNGAELFAGADASLRDDGMISGVAKAGLSGSF